MATKLGTKQQAAADQEFDPKYEWLENATSFVLRVHLTGFRKEDFRVQVDGAGRLTVRGQRAIGGGKHIRFHKVFQLPPTSNLDDISGRFDAGVLTLTVPKRPAAPPATIEEIIKQFEKGDQVDGEKKTEAKKPQQDHGKPKGDAKKPEHEKKETKEPTKDEMKKPAEQHKEEVKKPTKDEAKKPEQHKDEIKKPMGDDAKPKEDAKKKAEDLIKEEVKANRSKPEQEQRTATPAARKEEDKPTKAEAVAAAAPTETKPPRADGERATAKAVDRDSLVERVRRRAEEERAKAAAAAEEAERQRRTVCGGWKERVTEELQGIAGSEWAEGLVDTVKKNKEVIAAAVAAFSLGLFVSSRLFSRK